MRLPVAGSMPKGKCNAPSCVPCSASWTTTTNRLSQEQSVPAERGQLTLEHYLAVTDQVQLHAGDEVDVGVQEDQGGHPKKSRVLGGEPSFRRGSTPRSQSPLSR